MSAVLWLNDLPLWTAALVIIGGTIALSIIGTAVSGLFFGEQALSLNNVVGGFKYMFVAGIYAGFLGFLLLGVYNRYDKVRAAIIDEVNELTTLDRLAVAFPAATTATLRNGLKQYAQDVVAVEWPQLRDRNADPITMTAFDTLERVYAAVEPTTRKQQAVMKQSRRILSAIRDKRSMRVLRSFGALQVLLWVVTGIGTAVAIMLAWTLGSPNVNATMLMSILVTLLMASVVLVVLKLSYPFSGSSGLLPTPYTAFIAEVSAWGG